MTVSTATDKAEAPVLVPTDVKPDAVKKEEVPATASDKK